ncbi:MAG: ribokinase [Rhodospirillales bacterium]|nr:ribokinase [Rhodospirillales bacterium]
MIVVFGSINLDLIFALPAIPRPGETLLGPAARIEPGGKGANQAVAAARDGANVAMVGAVGADALAEGALALLTEAGVDLSRVARVDAATGCAAIAVDPEGRNAIAVGSGANVLVRADQVAAALLGPGSTLLLQMEVPAAENAALIRRARAAGARVILNLAPAAELAEAALAALDLLVVNETEAAWLAARLGCGAAAGDLAARLAIGVIRTLGGEGAEYAGPEGAWSQPAMAVAVRDTTAAGDCFLGVLAAALDRGIGLRAAMARAGMAAGLACTRAGSQGSLPRAAEIDAVA